MNKIILIVIASLLIFSLGFNIYQGILLDQKNQEDQELFEAFCRNVAERCTYVSFQIDYSIQNNDRRLLFRMGITLDILGAELHTADAVAYGVIEKHWISYLGTIFNTGDSYKNIAPIGRLDDDSPFTEWELQVLKTISQALKDCAQVFYDDPDITEYNYRKAELKHKSLEQLNQALADFEKATSPLFDQK